MRDVAHSRVILQTDHIERWDPTIACRFNKPGHQRRSNALVLKRPLNGNRALGAASRANRQWPQF